MFTFCMKYLGAVGVWHTLARAAEPAQWILLPPGPPHWPGGLGTASCAVFHEKWPLLCSLEVSFSVLYE